jgi:5-methylcytosine-specific restriction endonuclease McrA
MKVNKVGDVIDGEVLLCARQGEVAGLLTSLEAVANPKAGSAWTMEITVDQDRPQARTLRLQLPPLISESDSLQTPLFLGRQQLVFFRNRIFLAERPPKCEIEREEIALRVKKAVYEEEADLLNLKASVANLEAAIEYTRTGPKRDAIPDDVKFVVWARDGGACVKCGAKQKLHYDHILPVAKGGDNSAENIQILCQSCNLRKSDKLA